MPNSHPIWIAGYCISAILEVSRSLCSGFSAVIFPSPSLLSLVPMHPFLPSHFDICSGFLSCCGNDGNKTTRTRVWACGLLFDVEKLILTLPVHPECEQMNPWDYGESSLPLSGWESKSITNRIVYAEQSLTKKVNFCHPWRLGSDLPDSCAFGRVYFYNLCSHLSSDSLSCQKEDIY